VEHAASLSAGTESARAGRFQAVVTAPVLKDGSWKRLLAVSRRCGSGFAIILVAKKFDLGQWAQALDDGALEVLDAVYELPRAAEAARRALWTEYLTGAWPDLEVPDCSTIS
jgi:DNA-binding NtrC family response regulator